MIRLTIREDVSILINGENIKGKEVDVIYSDSAYDDMFTIVTNDSRMKRVWKSVFKESKEEIERKILEDKFAKAFGLKSIIKERIGKSLIDLDPKKEYKIRGLHADKVFKDELTGCHRHHNNSKSNLDTMDDSIMAMRNNCFCRCTAIPGGERLYHEIFNTINLKQQKMKTKNLTFDLEGRKVTLVSILREDKKIEVGYSVCYKDEFDENLGKKIAKGRAEKNPIYSISIVKDTPFFMKSTLELVKRKLIDGDIKIKGIKIKVNKRAEAMKWWNSLSELEQRGILHLNNLFGREPKAVTGREIEGMYNKK